MKIIVFLSTSSLLPFVCYGGNIGNWFIPTVTTRRPTPNPTTSPTPAPQMPSNAVALRLNPGTTYSKRGNRRTCAWDTCPSSRRFWNIDGECNCRRGLNDCYMEGNAVDVEVLEEVMLIPVEGVPNLWTMEGGGESLKLGQGWDCATGNTCYDDPLRGGFQIDLEGTEYVFSGQTTVTASGWSPVMQLEADGDVQAGRLVAVGGKKSFLVPDRSKKVTVQCGGWCGGCTSDLFVTKITTPTPTRAPVVTGDPTLPPVTSVPTSAPQDAPSTQPSHAPVVLPSLSPTSRPTPTPRPTQAPQMPSNPDNSMVLRLNPETTYSKRGNRRTCAWDTCPSSNRFWDIDGECNCERGLDNCYMEGNAVDVEALEEVTLTPVEGVPNLWKMEGGGESLKLGEGWDCATGNTCYADPLRGGFQIDLEGTEYTFSGQTNVTVSGWSPVMQLEADGNVQAGRLVAVGGKKSFLVPGGSKKVTVQCGGWCGGCTSDLFVTKATTPTPNGAPVETVDPTPSVATLEPTRSPQDAPVSTQPTQAPVVPPSQSPTRAPVASPPTVCECPQGMELDGDRCYEPCGEQFEGAGAFCEYKCPLGYLTPLSGFCFKTPTLLTTPSFTQQNDCENRCSYISSSGSCGECGFWGRKKWYPDCPLGYERVVGSCEKCLPKCPNGWDAESLYCKPPPAISRGPGTQLPCATALLNNEWGEQQQCIQEAFARHQDEFDVDGVKDRFGFFASIDSATELLAVIGQGDCPKADIPSSFVASLRVCFPDIPIISTYLGLTFDASFGVKGVATVAVATDSDQNMNCFLATCGGLGLSGGLNAGVAIGVMLDAGVCTFGGESRGIEFDLPAVGVSVGIGMQTTKACSIEEEKKVFELVVGAGVGVNLLSATKCYTQLSDYENCPEPEICEEPLCPLESF